MPRIRYTGGSRYSLRDGPTFEDREGQRVAAVDAATADRLCADEPFERVGSETESEPDETDTAAEAESGASGGSAGETTEGSDGDDDADEPAGTCEHVLSSGDREGEECGRDMPCPYHGGD